jgi:hypothetical protein
VTFPILRATAVLAILSLGHRAFADDFELAPILYGQSKPANPVSRLQERIDHGQAKLDHEDHFGYLRSVLRELGVPESSQMLVFSKTSLQRQRIAPRTPRSLYFNDDTYVGFCQLGDILEISAVDPQLGTVFYTLDQERVEKPRFNRQTDTCLICHAGSQTRGVPGLLMRSVFADSQGYPVLSAGSYRLDHTSPFEHRWGGWYVTGTHGDLTHLGNLVVSSRQGREPVDNPEGMNLTDLSRRIDVGAFLTPHSDIVALTVLEHQAEGHNLITRANFQTRMALHQEVEIARTLGLPAGQHLDSTASRIKSVCEPLVQYLLFSGEPTLTAPVKGTSDFAAEFARQGPKDPQGRSLRDFDLQRRTFKYPCSYLVYTDAFAALPGPAKEYVYRRMGDVLSGHDTSKEFAHLSAADRQAIREILLATKTDLPDSWRAAPAAGTH